MNLLGCCPLTAIDEIHKHWDPVIGAYTARVLPGQYYVSAGGDECIGTVLGSCVAACVRDSRLNIGGLNHFMLPGDEGAGSGLSLNRFGAFAMENLINDILKLGGSKTRLEIKLFGGGKIMRGLSDIGQKNIDFVKSFLSLEGYHIAAEDLGGEFSRKILYFPATGKVKVKRLRSVHAATVAQQEASYESKMRNNVAGSIELFD